jgi:O-antigen ligase
MAAGVGLFVWILALRQYSKAIILGSICLLGVFLIPALPKLVPSLQREHLSAQDSEITDLTGRTEMWGLALEVLSERPLLGYGYEVSGKVWNDPQFAHQSFVGQWGSSKTSLHNGYLDVAIGSGILGVGLWLLILFSPLRGLIRLPLSDERAFYLAFIVQFLALNFFESAISTSRSFGSLAFWILWVAAGKLPDLAAPPEAEAEPAEITAEIAVEG